MIDLRKPVQTRDGKKAIVYATNRGGEYPVHGSVLIEEVWVQRNWTEKGEFDQDYLTSRDSDLVNVPAKMLKRRIYVTTWGERGWQVSDLPISKVSIGAVVTALNFPVNIEIPEGFGL